jgi:hypothetical protein
MGLFGMTKFEKFAYDHTKHLHCMGCAGCILQPGLKELVGTSVWCTQCRDRIEASVPEERWPWFEYGFRFNKEGKIE